MKNILQSRSNSQRQKNFTSKIKNPEELKKLEEVQPQVKDIRSQKNGYKNNYVPHNAFEQVTKTIKDTNDKST